MMSGDYAGHGPQSCKVFPMKPSITAMLIISNLMSLSVYAEEAMFTCSTRENSSFNIIVDVDVETSVLVLTDSHVDGKVKSTAHHYFITYPATKDRYETHISINRYSGSLDWEHGDKPFGEMNPRNVFYNGTCKLLDAEKL